MKLLIFLAFIQMLSVSNIIISAFEWNCPDMGKCFFLQTLNYDEKTMQGICSYCNKDYCENVFETCPKDKYICNDAITCKMWLDQLITDIKDLTIQYCNYIVKQCIVIDK